MIHSHDHQMIRSELSHEHAYSVVKERCICGSSMPGHAFISHVIDEALEYAMYLHDHAHDYCEACETVYIAGYNAGHDDGRRGFANDHSQESTT